MKSTDIELTPTVTVHTEGKYCIAIGVQVLTETFYYRIPRSEVQRLYEWLGTYLGYRKGGE